MFRGETGCENAVTMAISWRTPHTHKKHTSQGREESQQRTLLSDRCCCTLHRRTYYGLDVALRDCYTAVWLLLLLLLLPLLLLKYSCCTAAAIAGCNVAAMLLLYFRGSAVRMNPLPYI